jgi:hypothetical protein
LIALAACGALIVSGRTGFAQRSASLPPKSDAVITDKATNVAPNPALSEDQTVKRPAPTAAKERPVELSIEKPLIEESEWSKWRLGGKVKNDYNSRVRDGDLGRDSKEIVANGIRIQVYALTLPSERLSMSRLISALLLSVHNGASSKPDAGARRIFREAMMKEIVARCRKLEDNQLLVRVAAGLLLGHLFIEEETPGVRGSAQFYTGSQGTYDNFMALMEFLEKEGQPTPVKLVAVNGLRNVATNGNPALPAALNIRMAKALIAQLEKNYSPDTDWYQERLCDTLASINQVNDLDAQPFIAYALAKTMFDPNRSLCARSAAAKAIARAQLSQAIDLNVVAYGLADLGRQMAEARKQKKHLNSCCVMNLFLAFKPRDMAEKAQHAGLLDRVDEPSFKTYKKMMNEVYALLRPMFVHEYTKPGDEFPPEAVAPILDWIKTNPPPNQLRIAPGYPPLAFSQVTKAESSH